MLRGLIFILALLCIPLANAQTNLQNPLQGTPAAPTGVTATT